jgi:hypothetical protein
MKKKISAVVLAGLFAIPMAASAGSDADNKALMQRVEQLSKELNELKAAMAEQTKVSSETAKQVNDMQNVVINLDDRAEEWDVASRFKISGDFRTRLDYYTADTASGKTLNNDSLWTNRLRLNLEAKATENVEFKGRLAMYKAWGMESAFRDDSGSMWPVFDGNTSRTPSDSALYVDRAMITWNNIGGAPVWFSIGRRPTTDGPPAEIRMGTDHRMATPVAYMDWPFDGLTLAYRYKWADDLGSGKLRFCYGRGYENGLQLNKNTLDDTDFAGFEWDVLEKGPRNFQIQSFMAFNLFNYPNFQDPIINANFGNMSGMGLRKTSGNLLHTTSVYQDKYASLNYFIAGGWSKSLPDHDGLFNDIAMGPYGVDTKSENGYSVYLGVRYDLDNIGLKLGAEYNWGSQYWLAMTPGNDDIYQSKLAARGSVYEVYGIYNLPSGPAVSKYAKAFIRFGYQHYDYNYAGSGNWNYAPYDLGSRQDLMKLHNIGLDPIKTADQIYVSMEAYF